MGLGEAVLGGAGLSCAVGAGQQPCSLGGSDGVSQHHRGPPGPAMQGLRTHRLTGVPCSLMAQTSLCSEQAWVMGDPTPFTSLGQRFAEARQLGVPLLPVAGPCLGLPEFPPGLQEAPADPLTLTGGLRAPGNSVLCPLNPFWQSLSLQPSWVRPVVLGSWPCT